MVIKVVNTTMTIMSIYVISKKSLRVSSIGLEKYVRYFVLVVGHGFDSLDPLGIRPNNQGRQFTSFTIHGSWESTQRVFYKGCLEKKGY
jgi:hypothetical protein